MLTAMLLAQCCSFSLQNLPPSTKDAMVIVDQPVPAGSMVHQVIATDPEGKALTYAIASEYRMPGMDPAQVVAIDSSTGKIFLGSKLDDSVDALDLSIKVSDGETFAYASVLLQVNRPPKIVESAVSIHPSTPPGTSILQIPWGDDGFPHGTTSFSIVSALPTVGSSLFLVTDQGILRIAPNATLSTDVYALEVQASDGSLVSKGRVDVTVSTNAPLIRVFSNSFE